MASSRGWTRAARAVVLVLALAGLLPLGFAHADHQPAELVSIGPAGSNGALDVSDFFMARDGSRAFFLTNEALVSADTDSRLDLYERAGSTTTLLSTGRTGGNGPFDVIVGAEDFSQDGSRVLFSTSERLTEDDTDDRQDVYERSAGVTRLVSTGPAGGNGDFDVRSSRISLNGAGIAFSTQEALTSDDTNAAEDAYLRSGGQTTLVAEGPVNESHDVLRVIGISPDGRRVFLHTTRTLVGNDTDIAHDLYSWEDGVTTMESVGPNGENAPQTTFTEFVADDGEHVAFETYGQLAPEDTDASPDVYVRSRDTTTLASIGPVGGNGPVFATPRGISSDGGHVFFETAEPLVAADTDEERDLYTHGNGVTELVSTGPLAGGPSRFEVTFWDSSADGRRVFFTTGERLVPEDTDDNYSAYEYSEGTARWLAPALRVLGSSQDGARVFILTTVALVSEDTDSGCPEEGAGCADVYEIHQGRISLISTGPTDAHGSTSACRASFGPSVPILVCPFSASDDGTGVLFWHNAPLTAADTDTSYDVYQANVRVGPQRADHRNAAQFCRAERDFLGEEAFAERYAKHRNGANAFGKCVSAK